MSYSKSNSMISVSSGHCSVDMRSSGGKRHLNRCNKTCSTGFTLASISLSNNVGSLPSSTVSHAIARTEEVTCITNGCIKIKQVKDLHLGEQLLSQTPTEKFVKQCFRWNVQIPWLPCSCKLKTNLHWSKDLLPD